MAMNILKENREKRAIRVRRRLKSVAKCNFRLMVRISNKHIYSQIIDDEKHITVASASTIDNDLRGKLKSNTSIEAAEKVGKLIMKRSTSAGVKEVFYDRGERKYHGRVKALADAAREGLKF